MGSLARYGLSGAIKAFGFGLFVVNKFHAIVDESMQGWFQFSAMGVAPAFLISLVPELPHVRLELVRRGRG